jgi:LysR family transcriptional regulator, glycine cleavage system transcriptional activator
MPFTRLPNLAVLRAFEATVRHMSVARAAAEIGVTDGAVSRAVREMEAALGFELFTRGNRKITPTAVARPLAAEIRGGLERIAAALADARRAVEVDRPLVLSCEPTFLIRWLIPRLEHLQAAIGTERDVRLISAGGPVPFGREGIDLAIRRADFELDASILAEPFLDERVGPVCRPDLAHAVRTEGPLAPIRELHFEHFYLSLQATVAGAGSAIGPIALVIDDIASGTLVAPRGFTPDGSRYILMAPRATVDGAMFAKVLEWLRAAMP